MMAKWWLLVRTGLLMVYLLWLRWVFSTGAYRGLLSWIGILLLVAVWVGDRRYLHHRYTASSWLWFGLADTALAFLIQFALILLFGFVWYQPIILVLFVMGHGYYIYRLGQQVTKSR